MTDVLLTASKTLPVNDEVRCDCTFDDDGNAS